MVNEILNSGWSMKALIFKFEWGGLKQYRRFCWFQVF